MQAVDQEEGLDLQAQELVSGYDVVEGMNGLSALAAASGAAEGACHAESMLQTN